MGIEVVVTDGSSQLAVKDAVLAKSGYYVYSHDEVMKMGIKPTVEKPFYREYRPAGVLVDAKDLFQLIPVTKDHPTVNVDADNFHQFASGTTGGPIDIIPMPDGEVGLRGKIAFHTKDAYDHYISGNRETSAGYDKKLVMSDDPDKDGYDWIMTKITAVNHMAVLPKGRGGKDVRVFDKAPNNNINENGGIKMSVKGKSGFLARLGIGKQFKFSKVLMDSVAKVSSLDAAGIDKEVASVMAHVNTLGDGDAKEVLVGAVSDCYKNHAEVLQQKDVVSEKIDELYVKCQDADAEVVTRILDSGKEDEKDDGKKDDAGKEKEKEKEVDTNDAAPPDFAVMIDAAVQKSVAAVMDGLHAKIDASIKKAIGVDDKEKKANAADERQVDAAADAGISEDASFLTRGIFGSN
jgi:hypothetical protein